MYDYLVEKIKIPCDDAIFLKAAILNNLNFVKKLYEKSKLDPNKISEKGFTAIFFAAFKGNFEMFKYLIETCKADPLVKSDNGTTVLHFALEGKNLDIVKYLVEKYNPDPNCKTDENINIYHSAAASENIEILKYIWNKYPNEKLLLDQNDLLGTTPLHNAISTNQEEMVKFFLDTCKVDINIKTRDGLSLMAFSAKFGSDEMLEFLNTNYKLDYNEIFDHRHILFLSVENRNLPGLSYFLDKKNIDPNIKDDRGWTPMHVAAYFGHLIIIEYLIEEKSCSPFIKDNDGFTPSMIAEKKNHLDIVEYLDNFKK